MDQDQPTEGAAHFTASLATPDPVGAVRLFLWGEPATRLGAVVEQHGFKIVAGQGLGGIAVPESITRALVLWLKDELGNRHSQRDPEA